jgi:hypothetical protein
MDTQIPPQKSILKNPYLYSMIVFLVVFSYVVILFVSRYKSNRAFQARAREKAAERRRADDRAALEQLGGSELAIRSLYISPAIVHPGASTQLCYDVVDAKSVTLDPPEGQVWPSHFRCLDLFPKKSTTYTLTITDAAGKSLSQSVQLQVR